MIQVSSKFLVVLGLTICWGLLPVYSVFAQQELANQVAITLTQGSYAEVSDLYRQVEKPRAKQSEEEHFRDRWETSEWE